MSEGAPESDAPVLRLLRPSVRRLAADPLADIRNVRRIERVIARGAAHTPEALLAGLPKS